MPKKSIMKRLTAKILAIVALFSIVLFLFRSINSIYSRRARVMPFFVERAKATAYSLEASIGDEQELQDQARLLAIVQKNMWLDPDIISIDINTFQDNGLATYVSNHQGHVGRPASQANQDAVADDMFASQAGQSGDTEILTVVSPIHISGKISGTIQIDFDLSTVSDKVRETLVQEISYYVLGFLVFIAVLFIFFHVIVVKPILEVSRGVQEITGLNFDYKIKARFKDEIGDLASAFNKMGDEIKESKEQLSRYNETLKKDVAAKTKDLEKARDELKNINVDLEQKVRERTTKLEELKASQEKVIADRTAELSLKIAELEKTNKIMVDREVKMVELKDEIKRLKGEA